MDQILTFTDAVIKYGQRLSRVDLKSSYGQLRGAFADQLTNTFLVLHEEFRPARDPGQPQPQRTRTEITKAQNPNPNKTPARGSKRNAEGTGNPPNYQAPSKKPT